MFGSKKKEKEELVFTPEVPVIEEPVIEEPVPAPKAIGTLIGPGIKFTGNIEAKEDIEINGRVEGNITSGNTITVTEGGSILGDVKAKEFILRGTQEGDSEISGFCKISKDGKFFGNMIVSSLVTEDGAEFEGHLSLKKKSAPAPIPAPAEEEEV